jgi:DNA end-binding protein Ku
MIHPLWSGTISFGIVTIPVHLTPAIHEHAIHFHQISKSGRGRVHHKKVVHGKDGEASAGDIVKGYEIAKNRYVTCNDDEIKHVLAQKRQELEITELVDLAGIDPRYFNHLSRLVPGTNGAKPYQLLLRALQQAKRVGLARLVRHNKEHVATVRSLDGVRALQTLHFADEIVIPSQSPQGQGQGTGTGAVRVTGQELALAGPRIESMSGVFRPGRYKDDYTQRVKRAIARKAKGKPLEIAGEEKGHDECDTEVSHDLMAALDRSLGMHKATKGATKPDRKPSHARRSRTVRKAAPAPLRSLHMTIRAS